MAKIEKSPLLGRKIRRDDWPEIGKPTWTFLEEAIKAGKTKEALELLEYALFEARTGHHVYVLFANLWNDYIGQKYGEDAIEGFWRALRARPPEQLPTYYMPSHADKVVGNAKESV
ncbi:MAG: hypothetical protein Q8O76_05490, partial [Chloroflexota bacterium]|nr:hypothetical protein [Chloroflexota bacterium]